MAAYGNIASLATEDLARFSHIIDVRSPAEFAEDHVPGAINLPVLDDAERAKIGTIYKQISPFDARKQGAALVSRNIAHHLETRLAGLDGRFNPLVYCWRGGMRSNSMAMVLASVGWRVTVLDGGYRTWRREVVAGLDAISDNLPLILIDGQTGVAKTAILHQLAAQGAQTIDLEGFAHHRGSAFGDMPGLPQPSQKAFESRLWQTLREHDLAHPIYAEAESSLIGRCRIPAKLWRVMKAAPRIEVQAELDARARYLLGAYPELTTDPARLSEALDKLATAHPRSQIDAWRAMGQSGAWEALAASLITEHYDPAYKRARKRQAAELRAATVSTTALNEADIARLAKEILQLGQDLVCTESDLANA